MRHRVAAVVATVAVAAALLAGCGSDGHTYEGSVGTSPTATGPSATATATTTAPATATPTASASSSIDPSVASEAQSLAAAAQAQASGMGNPLAPHDGPVLGADISWPQCPAGMGIPHKISTGQPMPREDAEYVVIGLTNGPGFHANPCLADQVAYAKGRGLLTAAYAVASFPDDATVKAYGRGGPYAEDEPGAALLNTGYQQAIFNVAAMHKVGLQSPIVWIDVESVPYYDWSADPVSNAYVVTGAAKGYLDSGLQVGVYSTPHLWASVVGALTLGQVPEWRAAGETSQEEALSRCGPDWSIQGGPGVLGQWVEEQRDRNITCPGIEADLGAYFAPPGAG